MCFITAFGFLHFHHLDHLDLTILLDELLGVHVATTHSDHKAAIEDLCQDLLGAEHVVARTDSLHLNREFGLVQVAGKHFIYCIALHWLV